MLFSVLIISGYTGYSTGGSDVVRAAGVHHEEPDDDDDYNATEPLHKTPNRKDSPPSYDGHCMYCSFFLLVIGKWQNHFLFETGFYLS